MLINSLALMSTGGLGTALGLGLLGGALGTNGACNRCSCNRPCVRVPDFARRPPCLRGCRSSCNRNCNIQPFATNAGLFNNPVSAASLFGALGGIL